MSDKLMYLRALFQSTTSLHDLDKLDESWLKQLEDANSGVMYQNLLLGLTLDSDLNKKYPVKYKYQEHFLRFIIDKLEEKGAEISDSLYSRYCQLLSTKAQSGPSYRHYSLRDGTTFTLEESSSIVSVGTTGLCTWEASPTLATWAAENCILFEKKTILELGSGVGLCGLAVSHLLQPSLYCFSDCHSTVLDTLIRNLDHNVPCRSEKPNLGGLENIAKWLGKYKSTELAVLDLPWEDVPSSNISSALLPDVVLAADVVYDKDLFQPLLSALKYFAERGSKIVLSCTVRNPNTIKEFLDLLGSMDLHVVEKDYFPGNNIIVTKPTLVKIVTVNI